MTTDPERIAVIGLACRVPGAGSATAFWNNLRYGVESIAFYRDEDLLARGVPAAVLRDPNYVRASAPLDGADLFAAEFFGYSPREAELMDPQHRVFLETAWHAMEDAGHAGEPDGPGRRTGVFAGATMNTYLPAVLRYRPDLLALMGDQQVMVANDKDYLATRVSYHLDLHGPGMTVQTACSSSLTAIHLACQSLLSGEADLALAGGASVRVPQGVGYLYQPGGTNSPDGHCRAFDADAAGSVAGSGVGAVVLRRLTDALAAGDTVRAVILGSAVNNDGAGKVGFTAPSVAGQVRVVRDALAAAGVPADTIEYLEPHGTGTKLGDPIEVTALGRAYRATTDRRGYCALGSVKTNIGHLDAAAGVIGFIKAVLCLGHRQLVPSLHFTTPNEQIDWANGPFYVNTRLKDWLRPEHPRRAACSSFGMGGANAHVILEEPPDPEPDPAADPPAADLLVVSAKTPEALDEYARALAVHLDLRPDQPVPAVCHSSRVGRRAFLHRRAVVGGTHAELAAALRSGPRIEGRSPAAGPDPRVGFLVPGQGTEHPGMGRGLYFTVPAFRAVVDECAAILRPLLGADIREVFGLTGGPADDPRAADPRFVQPGLFAVSYALAQVWIGWGCRPAAVAGHSLGEYVAACLAGVFGLDDALRLVAARGRLAAGLPEGGMASVPAAEADLLPLLADGVAVAAVNAPGLCTVSGPRAGLANLHAALAARGVGWVPLPAVRAYHSPAVDAITGAFREEVARIPLGRPTVPVVSNLTGTWLTAEQATDPQYWVDHLRQPVRFADAIRALQDVPGLILVEAGPGATLRKLLGHASWPVPTPVVSSLPDRAGGHGDLASLVAAVGQVWADGGPVDWKAFSPAGRRVSLPGYPFRRTRHWIDAHPVPAEPDRAVDGPPPAAAPPPAPARGRDRPGYVAPTSDAERRVAALWEEMLGVEPVGRTDSFFELGGHSLLAVQLISRLRDQFKVELPVATFLGHPTVADLAAYLTRRPDPVSPGPPAVAPAPPAAPSAPPAPYPGVSEAELDAILTEIEKLSPDEVRARLAREGGPIR